MMYAGGIDCAYAPGVMSSVPYLHTIAPATDCNCHRRHAESDKCLAVWIYGG